MKSTMRWLRGALFLLLLGGNAEAQKVVEVEVQGELRKVAESLILSTISLVPGIELSQENVQAAVRDLQGLNVFSDIQIWGDPAPGGVKLFVMVVEMPALEGVRFKGNENLKEKEMKEGLGLVVGQVVSDADVIRGEQTILELYREKGYLRAQISGRLFDAEEKGKVFLQYEIDEGEKVKIKQINLKLRHEDGTVSDRPEPPYDARRPGSARQLETAGLSQRAIKPLMETKEKRWWRKGEFKGEVLEEDKEKILGYYRSQGYQQAMVSRDSVYYDSTRKNLFIDLEIDEGMQYRLGAVDWGGNSLFSDWELAVRLELEKGAVYGYSGQELSDLVRMAYYEKGYLDTRVMADEQVRGDTVDLYPAYEEFAYQIEFFGDTIEAIRLIHPTTGEELSTTDQVTIYPAVHYVVGEETIERSVKEIKRELAGRVIDLKNDGKLLEAQRLSARTKYDMEMMQEVGYCPGVENYSRYFDGRAPGSKPYTLLDYFDDDYLLFIDESHVTLPQIRAMYNGDQARKGVLVDHGFRLPSALDNRPLKFEEFESMKKSTTYVSATPSDYELTQAGGDVVELVIRPTGLLDPEIEVRPATGQVADILKEIALLVADGYRVLITALTKRLSEDLSDYVRQQGFRCQYLHSEVDTLERVEILKQLREGKFDVLIGVNLLREGLDLPEVALVAVLDADKQGFLRSETALIQTIGRCARNASGRVILYGDTITPAMKSAIGETNRRRQLQTEYNEQHGITPTTIQKAIRSQLSDKLNARKTAQAALHASDDEFDRTETITELEHAMLDAAENLEFEKAARLRDRINELKNPDAANDAQATGGYQEPLKTTRGKKGGNARHIPDDTQ